MEIYDLKFPSNKAMTNFDLLKCAHDFKIPNFRGVYMLNEIPSQPRRCETAVVNLGTELGTHWVFYFKDNSRRIYFDSFATLTPIELQHYLKTKNEYNQGVIQRNSKIVQRIHTHCCGQLCLFVLHALTRKHMSYQEVLDLLDHGFASRYW